MKKIHGNWDCLALNHRAYFNSIFFFQRLSPLNLNSLLSYPSIMYGRTSLEANPRPFPFCLQFFWWLQAVFWLLLKYKFWSNRTDNFGKRLAEVHMYACKGTEQISPVQKYCQHPLECCLGSRLLSTLLEAVKQELEELCCSAVHFCKASL